MLSFDKTLPSLPIDQLKNDTAISFKMRKLTNKDLMDENILPIFYKDKIALLCVKESVILTLLAKAYFSPGCYGGEGGGKILSAHHFETPVWPGFEILTSFEILSL